MSFSRMPRGANVLALHDRRHSAELIESSSPALSIGMSGRNYRQMPGLAENDSSSTLSLTRLLTSQFDHP